MTNATRDILEALRAALVKIKRPSFRSTVKFVRIGLTAADLNGSERPFLALLYTGETDSMVAIGRRHQTQARVTVYAETADTEDAMVEMLDLIEDVKDTIKANEMLKPAGSSTGLVLTPMRVTNVDAVLDLDASAGIGSARIDLEVVYRTAHA
jgi:hypothetical protein